MPLSASIVFITLTIRQVRFRTGNLVGSGGKMIILETNTYNPISLRNIGVEREVRSFLNSDKNLTKWSVDAEARQRDSRAVIYSFGSGTLCSAF